MVKPTDEPRIIINVKGVPARSWEGAKASALKGGETLGSWLGRACDQLTERESGERFFPPENLTVNRVDHPATPAANPAAGVDLHAIAAALMALAQAGGTAQKRVVRQVNAVIFVQAGGQPRLAPGKADLENGKAVALPSTSTTPPTSRQ